MAEVGIQVAPVMVSASTEPDLQIGKNETAREKEQRRVEQRSKGKGKDRAKEQYSLLGEDTARKEADRLSPYKDLLEYEKEVDDRIASPAIQKPKEKEQLVRRLVLRLLWYMQSPAIDPLQTQHRT